MEPGESSRRGSAAGNPAQPGEVVKPGPEAPAKRGRIGFGLHPRCSNQALLHEGCGEGSPAGAMVATW